MFNYWVFYGPQDGVLAVPNIIEPMMFSILFMTACVIKSDKRNSAPALHQVNIF